MAFDFPSGSLTVGQIVVGPNGIQYQWDGVKWTAAPLSSNFLPLTGGTLTGPMTVTPTTAGQSAINLNDAAGNTRQLNFETAGSMRWQINAGSVAESGSNAGSNLNILRYADNGTVIATPLTISRATGVAAFNQIPTAPTPTAGDNSTNLATTAFVANAVGSGGGSGYLPLTGGTLTGALNVNGVAPGGNVTYAFPMSINAPANNASLIAVNGQAGANKGMVLQTNGNYRWTICAESSAETGSNVGADLGIFSYPDTGNTASMQFQILRANGQATFYGANVNLISPSGIWSELYLQKAASGVGSQIIGQTGTSRRWSMCLGDAGGETGSNAGSDFQLYHYNDSGTNMGSCLTILRSSGNANFTGNVTGGSYTSNGSNAGLYLNGRNGSGDQFCIYTAGDSNLHFWDSSNGDMALMTPSRFTYYNGITCMNAPQIRMQSGNSSGGYTAMLHNDGSTTYILLTNQNDAYGTWNGLRPFSVQNSNGLVTMQNGVNMYNGVNCYSSNLYVSNVITVGAYPGSGIANAIIGYYQNGGFWNIERMSQSATSNFGFLWYNNGNSSATFSSAPSDRRLKSNIKAAGDALDIVSRIPVYDLDFNRGVKSTLRGDRSKGENWMPDSQDEHWPFSLIADEVGAVLPHAALKQTEDDGKEHWTALDVMHLNSVLWRAVQQLSEKVALLEARA